MKGLVSIIIPVYNCEGYIEKCLKSLINQTYENIEIIVVDDGSEDNSLDICKKVALSDNRVKVFNKENNGVSSARNYGISKSNGQYICFVDADDWVDERYCEVLINGFNDKIELSVVGISSSNKKIDNNSYKILEKNESFCKLFDDNNFFGFPVNKMYLKHIILSLGDKPFDENIYFCEDTLFNVRYLDMCTKKISYNPKKLYFYFQRDDSATNTNKITSKNLTVFDSLDNIEKILIKEYPSQLEGLYVFYLYNYYRLYVANKISNSRLILKNEKIKKIYKYIINSKKISFVKKMKIFIKYHFPMLNNYFYNLKKKK